MCSNTPGTGERIECTEDAASADDIVIESSGVDIDTSTSATSGISGVHSGSGNVEIEVSGDEIDGSVVRSDIDTTADYSHGIYGFHEASGELYIWVTDTDITTTSENSNGVFGEIDGDGFLAIDVSSTSAIETQGDDAVGISGIHNGEGEAEISVKGGVVIETIGAGASGVVLHHNGEAEEVKNDAIVTVWDSTVETAGEEAHGIRNVRAAGEGDVRTEVRDTTLDTAGKNAVGVYADNQGLGDIRISLQGGRITTKGGSSHGVYAIHQGDGDIVIDTRDGNAISPTGENSDGIVAYHDGTATSGSIAITVGGTVSASGAGAQGVRIGSINTDGIVQRAAPIGEDGYRKQTVTINASVRGGSGDAAGVFLAGGGRVAIGPKGSVGAASGIAILATGDTPSGMEADPAIEPRLLVDMNLDGRRVSQVIGDDWIVNDGGGTTIVVNGVTLHDADTGVTGQSAVNGAWNVRVEAQGVRVTDRTDPDPANWTISERAAGVIADRDFSAADFDERRPPPPKCPAGQIGTPPNCTAPPPPRCPAGQIGTPPNCTAPPPPMCPAGQIGTPPDCTAPPPPMCPAGQIGTPPDCTAPPPPERELARLAFVEEHAPRAAIYEALPGFLLRLDARRASDGRIAWPDSPVWVRFSGGKGSYASERASVGAEFEFDRFAAEAGLDFGLGENVRGSISVRKVGGSGAVASPAGGGKIDAQGYGVAIGVSWRGDEDWYARGRISFTRYELDLASSALGRLKEGIGARGRVLHIEAGRRMTLTGKTTLTPRAWVTHSAFDVDRFTDAANARFSLKDASRLTGGLGLAAATERDLGNGKLSLRGSIDLAQTLGGARTSVDVSGERLYSESARTRLLMGVGATYRKGNFSVEADLSAGGLGSGDEHYAGRVTFGMEF